jgi:hypothetical protein
MVRAVAPVAQNRMTRPFVNIPRSPPKGGVAGRCAIRALPDLCLGVTSERLGHLDPWIPCYGQLLESPGTPGAFLYCRRQLFANGAIASSRVVDVRWRAVFGLPEGECPRHGHRLARRRSFMTRGRPQRSVHHIQGLIDLVLANSTRRSRRRMQARSPL